MKEICGYETHETMNRVKQKRNIWKNEIKRNIESNPVCWIIFYAFLNFTFTALFHSLRKNEQKSTKNK